MYIDWPHISVITYLYHKVSFDFLLISKISRNLLRDILFYCILWAKYHGCCLCIVRSVAAVHCQGFLHMSRSAVRLPWHMRAVSCVKQFIVYDVCILPFLYRPMGVA